MVGGISTACFYPMLTETALRWVAEHGVAATEVFFNAPSELEDGFLRELCRIAGNTKIISVHPFTSGLEPLLFFSDYRRRAKDGIEIYKRFFHAANMLGARILVLHGDRRESTKPLSQYFDYFGELFEAGRRMGVLVAQENVPRCTSWTPDFFRAMAEYLPQARFVLDTKQSVRAGFSPMEMAAAMGTRLIHLHLSDSGEQGDCLPLGKGNFDLPRLLRQARDQGFDGGAVLELYRANYETEEELTESYRAICAAISNLDERNVSR